MRLFSLPLILLHQETIYTVWVVRQGFCIFAIQPILFIMKKFIITIFSFIVSAVLFAQKEIPCSDLKIMLDDALAKHHDDKGTLIGSNEHTGITEYKYHLDLSGWAVSCAIKEADFDGKIKSWGEILVYQVNNKEDAIKYAEFVKKELQECWTSGIDKT